jgi:acetyltransferase-like isoleucine patch superfamily enzyme
VIERNVWIAAGATIIGGVTVGENSVVAAGSVVTKNVPSNTLVGGNPARVIRSIAD